MNSFWICLGAVMPVFLIIFLGYSVKRLGWIKEDQVPAMNAVGFKVFMPFLCFYNVYNSDLTTAVRPRLILFAVCAVILTFLLCWLLSIPLIPQRDRRGVVVQGLFRSNYLIIGLPFAAGLAGEADLGIVTVLGAVIIPLYNVLAVIVLEANRGERPKIGRLLLEILKNPLILGSLAGLLFLAGGIHLPELLETPIRDLSRVASPLLLFLLGASFRFTSFRAYRKELWIVCLGRLVLIPGLALLFAWLFGFRGLEFIALLSMFGAGTAANSYTMAQQMGGDGTLAGDIVVLTGALCTLTLFIWSLLFKSLGLF